MKFEKKSLIPALILFIAAFTLAGCQVGQDDPLVAVKSRTERFSQLWELEAYTINGVSQDLTNSSLSWKADKNGVFEEKKQGVLFGFQTLETNQGSWRFVSHEEQVRITLEDGFETYYLDRLSQKDLWVRKIDGDEVHEMVFESRK